MQTNNLEFAFSTPIVVLDSETGGLIPKEEVKWKRQKEFAIGQKLYGEVRSTAAPILELAAVRLNPKTLEEESYFHTFIGPNSGETVEELFNRCHPKALQVNHLDEKKEEFVNAPNLSQAVQNFMYWLPGFRQYVIGGQNVQFDISFLNAAFEQVGKEERFIGQPLELQVYSKLYFSLPDTPVVADHKLETVCSALGIDIEGAHNALFDCRMTAEAMRKIFKRFSLK